MVKTKYNLILDFLSENKQPEYRFDQIVTAVFNSHISRFEDMTALPKDLRVKLSAKFGESVLCIQPVHHSVSKQATKVLFELQDGNYIETVSLAFREGWKSFCISSQSGCGFACPFCATGAIGLKRNLNADEITDQVLYFRLNGDQIDSISFMGMGEPLANPETFIALKTFTQNNLFALSPRRITISTIGIIPGIKRLTEEFPQINLTYSLHTPFDDQRNELVPINRQYPLMQVMTILDKHIQKTQRKVYIAYVLLHSVNDSASHAKALVSLLKNRGAWDYLYHVNLIRYNLAQGVSEEFGRSEKMNVSQFCQILERAGINYTIRQSFGNDVNAACGQLYGALKDAKLRK